MFFATSESKTGRLPDPSFVVRIGTTAQNNVRINNSRSRFRFDLEKDSWIRFSYPSVRISAVLSRDRRGFDAR